MHARRHRSISVTAFCADRRACATLNDARAKTFQWGEDGILGWTDEGCYLCFSLALWNGQDDHLKERLFGLTNEQGNHGEDVKEVFFYLDATPTGSYAKALYKYPQGPFPYQELRKVNGSTIIEQPEFELLDTGAFDSNRYFDVVVEYAKRDPEDLQIQITVSNRGEDDAPVWLIPTLIFRNTWSAQSQEPGESSADQRALLLSFAVAGGGYTAWKRWLL